MIFLLINCRILSVLSYLPINSITPFNQDLWLSILFSVLFSVLFSIPLLFLSNRFRSLSLTKYTEIIAGKAVAKIYTAAIISVLFIESVFMLNSSLIFVKNSALSHMPVIVLLIIFTAVCFYADYKGKTVIARSALIFVPIILVVIILLSFFGLKNTDFTQLLPIYKESGVFAIAKGAFSVAVNYSEIFIFAFLIPKMQPAASVKKIFTLFLAVSTVFILLIAVLPQLTLGVNTATEFKSPFFYYTRLIQVSSFLQNVESLQFFVWAISCVLKFSLYVYIICLALKSLLNLKNNNKIKLPVLILISAATLYLYYQKSAFFKNILSQKNITMVLFPLIFIIPLILLIVYFIRKKKINYQPL